MAAAAEAPGPVQTAVQEALTAVFSPTHLEVVNESFMHNVPKGSETHFKVHVVSAAFEGVRVLQRHRQVNEALAPWVGNPIHALSIVAKTPAQAAKQGTGVEPSPSCRGGFGQ